MVWVPSVELVCLSFWLVLEEKKEELHLYLLSCYYIHLHMNQDVLLRDSQYVWRVPLWLLDEPCAPWPSAPLGGETDGWRLSVEPGELETAEQTEPCGEKSFEERHQE